MTLERHSTGLRSLMAGGLLSLVLLLLSSPAAAECTSYDPWPSFREVAPTAGTVLSGEVVRSRDTDSAGFAIRFDVRVDHVYLGEAPDVLGVDALFSGLPLTICDESILRTHVGDVIALAFDGRVAGFDGPVKTVASIEGRPDRFLTPEVERITENEIRSLLELLPADTATPASSAVTPLPLIAAGSGLGLLLWLRRRRRVEPRG